MSVIACIVITLLCFCFADMYVDIFVFESYMRVICLLMMNLLYVYVLSFMSHPIINILYMTSVQQYHCSTGSWNLRQSYDHDVVFLLNHKYIW